MITRPSRVFSTNTNGKRRFCCDALRSPAFYVGALGSRQTHQRRLEALHELGAGPEDIARLKGPIGLFASHDPRSLAVSALAEIIKVWTDQERKDPSQKDKGGQR